MQIVLPASIGENEKTIINNSVSAVFISNNKDIFSFAPERTLVISNNSEEKADFYFDTASFASNVRSYRIKALKTLSNLIFNTYVDPLEIIINFNKLQAGHAIVKQAAPVVEAAPVVGIEPAVTAPVGTGYFA